MIPESYCQETKIANDIYYKLHDYEKRMKIISNRNGGIEELIEINTCKLCCKVITNVYNITKIKTIE